MSISLIFVLIFLETFPMNIKNDFSKQSLEFKTFMNAIEIKCNLYSLIANALRV